MPQEHQKNPQEGPKSPPKEAQENPKTPSRASLIPKPCFFKNRAPAKAKSMFLRVGGSAWELKIDPKRFREKIKNDIEKRNTKRDENKSIKNDKKSFKKL